MTLWPPADRGVEELAFPISGTGQSKVPYQTEAIVIVSETPGICWDGSYTDARRT